jgi:membrane protease YdiL (CAAX protease family)
MGRKRALLLSGLVFPTWHLPLAFLTPVLPIGTRSSACPCFYAAVVAGSFFYGYLWLASGSVWPASIAHATHNSVSHDIEDHDSGSQHSIAQAGPTLARVAWTRGDLNQIRGNWQVAGER